MSRLSLLGAFEATLNGTAITTLKTDKVRALLAYLAVEADHPHRGETVPSLPVSVDLSNGAPYLPPHA